MESRGVSSSGSYVGHELYERNRPNSLGSVSKVGMAAAVAEAAEDVDGVGDSDRWFSFGCIC